MGGVNVRHGGAARLTVAPRATTRLMIDKMLNKIHDLLQAGPTQRGCATRHLIGRPRYTKK